MIRLLSKSEIAKSQSNDRAREIAEGLKLSRRVDGLRELSANEEQALEKWRSETLSAIGREISVLNHEKEDLIAEIHVLRKEKAEGLKKVEGELLSIVSFRNTLDQREHNLDEKLREVINQGKEIEIKLRNSADELERARTQKERAENLRRIADDDRKEAETTLVHARAIQENALKFKDNSEKHILEHNQAITQREKDIEAREKASEEVSKELLRERIRLADERATLARAFERLKTNNKK
jgi:hypothetical protein